MSKTRKGNLVYYICSMMGVWRLTNKALACLEADLSSGKFKDLDDYGKKVTGAIIELSDLQRAAHETETCEGEEYDE